MTTIAVRDGILACDSRCTGGYIGNVVKVAQGSGIIVGWSGDWIAGFAIAQYIAKLTQEDPQIGNDDVDFLILEGNSIFQADNKMRMAPISQKYWAIGSGGMAAMVAMNMGATSEEAVKEAIKVDEYSGGKVKTFTNS